MAVEGEALLWKPSGGLPTPYLHADEKADDPFLRSDFGAAAGGGASNSGSQQQQQQGEASAAMGTGGGGGQVLHKDEALDGHDPSLSRSPTSWTPPSSPRNSGGESNGGAALPLAWVSSGVGAGNGSSAPAATNATTSSSSGAGVRRTWNGIPVRRLHAGDGEPGSWDAASGVGDDFPALLPSFLTPLRLVGSSGTSTPRNLVLSQSAGTISGLRESVAAIDPEQLQSGACAWFPRSLLFSL